MSWLGGQVHSLPRPGSANLVTEPRQARGRTDNLVPTHSLCLRCFPPVRGQSQSGERGRDPHPGCACLCGPSVGMGRQRCEHPPPPPGGRRPETPPSCPGENTALRPGWVPVGPRRHQMLPARAPKAGGLVGVDTRERGLHGTRHREVSALLGAGLFPPGPFPGSIPWARVADERRGQPPLLAGRVADFQAAFTGAPPWTSSRCRVRGGPSLTSTPDGCSLCGPAPACPSALCPPSSSFPGEAGGP